MRGRSVLPLIISWFVLPVICYAHGGEELGHHWEVPAYVNEMRLQMIFMAVTALIIALAAVRRKKVSSK